MKPVRFAFELIYHITIAKHDAAVVLAARLIKKRGRKKGGGCSLRRRGNFWTNNCGGHFRLNGLGSRGRVSSKSGRGVCQPARNIVREESF